MRIHLFVLIFLAAALCNAQANPVQVKPPSDSSPHQIRFVAVDKDVKLEVLDWGGNDTGRPIVFLAGGGLTAHEFDDFAPKFTTMHHVYGITRRGSGASSAPAPDGSNYTTDRRADDVLAVIDDLKLNRPILVGHSLGGAELSSIGSRHPEKVAGLIYLDAGYSYAFYAPSLGDPIIDILDLKKRLDIVLTWGLGDLTELQHLQHSSALVARDLDALGKTRALLPQPPPRPPNAKPPTALQMAIAEGRQKYTEIHVPVIAIFADPHDYGVYKNDPAKLAALTQEDRIQTSAQADAFQAGIPSARVIRIPNASHMIFESNQAEVIAAMNAFLDTLP